jgi:hypothetical protein
MGGLDIRQSFDYEPLLLNATHLREEARGRWGTAVHWEQPALFAAREGSLAELCCVLEIAGSQHYPPSWVEAPNSLGQVVIGSATPVGASQWGFCRCGSRAKLLGSRGFSCDGRKGEGDYQGATSHAADRSSPPATSRSALRVVAPWALFQLDLPALSCT